MDHLPFNFRAYLENATGAKDWQVEELGGGAANYTVRVRYQKNEDDIVDDAVLTAASSVVIKQAPPFLAKHPQISCSPYRQVVEAEALHAFHPPTLGVPEPCTLPRVLLQNPRILIPRLLLHDHSNNVLVQSDLGPLPNLHAILTDHKTSSSLASQLGKIIGQFLADMHAPSILHSVPVHNYANEDSEKLMETIISQAAQHMRDAGVTDSKALGQLALEHWRTRKKTVFAQGDIWFGTLLIELEHSLMHTDVDNSTGVAVGICDWEFAGPNDVAADVAQLGAYLHLLSLSDMSTTRQHETTTAFTEAFYSTYFKSLKSPPDTNFWRSLLIMHGWEMINAAGWSSRQHLWCHCEGSGVRCNHIRNMIQEGVKVLRAGMDSGDGIATHKSNHRGPTDEVPWVRLFWSGLGRFQDVV